LAIEESKKRAQIRGRSKKCVPTFNARVCLTLFARSPLPSEVARYVGLFDGGNVFAAVRDGDRGESHDILEVLTSRGKTCDRWMQRWLVNASDFGADV